VPIVRVLLVGFMASGKSTVGREVARRLGWTFLDFDEEIERRRGSSISEIFATEGEAAFRELEARVGVDALRRSDIVLSSGGGWPVPEGRMESLPEGTLSVWLQVDPRTAVERARAQGNSRPLLQGPDAEVSARALSTERESAYARARLHLDTIRTSPETLALAIVDRVHRSRSNP
jgi:shikimate kinase